jgi:hypothetical protein
MLVNITPTSFFSSSRDLRQGDPLSPLLFVIVMEALGKISVAVNGGLLSGFSRGQTNFVSISHILFVDDTLIFHGIHRHQLCHLRGLFLCFEAGLKINLAKSKLVPVGNVGNVVGLTDIMGCGISSFPLKYLGLSLGASSSILGRSN